MLGERDKADIRTLYRDAADKSRQVRILMELFLASREEILDVLGPMAEPGRPKPSKKGLPKRSYTPEFKDEAKRRLRAGEGVHQVAEDMGVNVRTVPFPVSWTVKMKKKQKETQDILSYHTQAAGCSDKARAKASGGRQPIEECGRTGL